MVPPLARRICYATAASLLLAGMGAVVAQAWPIAALAGLGGTLAALIAMFLSFRDEHSARAATNKHLAALRHNLAMQSELIASLRRDSSTHRAAISALQSGIDQLSHDQNRAQRDPALDDIVSRISEMDSALDGALQSQFEMLTQMVSELEATFLGATGDRYGPGPT